MYLCLLYLTYEQLCPQPHVEPAEQEPLVASEPATPPRLKIVAMPVPPQEPRTSVKLEAKLIIPDNAINEETCMTFDSLKMYLNAYGFRATQRDHHLRIKGDWEDVTAALSEARKEILSRAKRRRLDERAGLRSTGCL